MITEPKRNTPLTLAEVTDLLDAASRNDQAYISKFIQAFTPEALAENLPDGRRLMTVAIEVGHLNIVETMIKCGFDINAPHEAARTTFLMEAVRAGKPVMAELLLENDAEANAENSDGRTALMLAAEDGQLATACLLLEYGSDYSTRDGKKGKTAEEIASAAGHTIVAEFIAKWPEIEQRMHRKGLDKVAALWAQSAQTGDIATVKALLDIGVDVNITLHGWTGLMLAASADQCDMIDFLVKAGADKDKLSPTGKTALVVAAQLGNKASAHKLLWYGASPLICDAAGDTAETIARVTGHDDVADLVASCATTAEHLYREAVRAAFSKSVRVPKQPSLLKINSPKI